MYTSQLAGIAGHAHVLFSQAVICIRVKMRPKRTHICACAIAA